MTVSVTFEIIEGLAAAPAAPQRLAGGRTEFGQELGVVRAALRTGDRLHTEQRATRTCRLRRRDAVLLELAAAVLAHPVGGPGRRQYGADFWLRKALALQRKLDLERDHVH